MNKELVNNNYLDKIKLLKKYDKFYHDKNKPLVSDQKYASLLGYNYLSSEWYKKSYKIFNKKYKDKKIEI